VILGSEEMLMSIQSSSTAPRLEEFSDQLKSERYAAPIQRRYLWVAHRFHDYLERKCIAIEAVGPPELEDFLRWELRSWRKRHGRAPSNVVEWRRRHKTAINVFLRPVHGHWPAVAAPKTAIEAFHRDLVQGYDAWMQNLRGLASATRSKRTTQAVEFLTELGPRGDQGSLAQLGVGDIDAYVQKRSKGRRRQTIEDYTVCLRSFLRYLHGSGRTALNLSNTVLGPRIYDNEQVPTALRPEEVQAVLDVTRQDCSPIGRRDYAFLMLLAAYGLRAGEVVALRLEDIDWKKEILHVRHSKTGAESELPLVREAGEAVLSYLENARPESKHRELFLQVRAPYRAYKQGSILNCVISARLKMAGINPRGRKGPHAFRHARAVSLLHATVPLKVIGDVLGHRSEKSTAVYLKLATEDLRTVGLNIPEEVLP
jgi:integrase/recombinase XerD